MSTLNEIVEDVQKHTTLSDARIITITSTMIVKTRQYVQANNLKSLVVGVSGGLDSAVVAAILQEGNPGVPLLGLSIPISSSEAHKEQARWVGEKYCTAFDEFYGWEMITNDFDVPLYEYIEDALCSSNYVVRDAGFNLEELPTNILQGNMKARLRMMALYDLARKTNGMVLSTDNLSELMAGFWTINGDVGDWGIIQNIWKGLELPRIARYLGIREDIITQKPSDGLSVTDDDTDEAQLGMTYPEFDTIVGGYLKMFDFDDITKDELHDTIFNMLIEDDSEDGKKVRAAIKRYRNTKYKRVGTINLTREELWNY